MGFDLKSFRKAEFQDRIETVAVPELRDWFEADEEPVFRLRSLTAEEAYRCNEAADRNRNIEAAITAMQGRVQKEKVEAYKKTLGLSEEGVPGELAKRLEYCWRGTVEPDMTHTDAVLFAENYFVLFHQITDKIFELTGRGRQVKKKSNSGKTPK